jgi:hypothetical protein
MGLVEKDGLSDELVWGSVGGCLTQSTQPRNPKTRPFGYVPDFCSGAIGKLAPPQLSHPVHQPSVCPSPLRNPLQKALISIPKIPLKLDSSSASTLYSAWPSSLPVYVLATAAPHPRRVRGLKSHLPLLLHAYPHSQPQFSPFTPFSTPISFH